MKTLYSIAGMHCASCAHTIRSRLEKIDGVESCDVNIATEKAEVVFDEGKVGTEKMNATLKPLGYELTPAISKNQTPADRKSTTDYSAPATHEHHNEQLEKLRWKVKVALPLTIVSVLIMAWDFATAGMTPAYWRSVIVGEALHHLMPPMATVMMFVVGPQYLKAVWTAVKHRAANMDTLVGIGTGVAYAYSLLMTMFTPLIEQYADAYVDTEALYYDVTIVVIGLITLGKYLEVKSKQQTGEAVKKLIGLQAKSALVSRDGKEVEVPIEEIVIGDVLFVKPGEKVPIDGVIVEGKSSIDESMVSGESMPADKQPGDAVTGGTINKQGSLRIRVTKVGAETMLARIIAMVEHAQGSRAPIQRLADSISAVFVPVVLVIAILTVAVWIAAGFGFISFAQALSLGVTCFVGVLVIACPCAMGLATPTAIVTGMGRGAQRGILVKNAEALERLEKVDVVVFDKTGTITIGVPTMTNFQLPMTDKIQSGKDALDSDRGSKVQNENEQSSNDHPPYKGGDSLSAEALAKAEGDLFPKDVFSILASLEKHSSHPLAEAIVKKAQEENIPLKAVEDFQNIEGKGVRGIIDGTAYLAGNVKFMTENGVEVDKNVIDTLASEGKTLVILSSLPDNTDLQTTDYRLPTILAYVGIADTVKDEAGAMIARLHAAGVKTILLTGDHAAAGRHIAEQVGINEVLSDVLPADKAKKIEGLKAAGHVVVMVGDGINDAPALAAADVGIAMATGTDVAIESAGITLLGGNVAKIPEAFTLSKKTMRVIRQNLFWAFAYNVLGIPIAAGLLYPFFQLTLSPAIAGAAMAFSSMSVVANSLRLKKVEIA